MKEAKVNVIGAGLAGSEAAWQLANRGIQVRLYEMRPVKQHQLIILISSQSLYALTLCVAMR